MNITNERRSLIRLWLESFAVVNRSTGKLLWVIIISVLLAALAVGVLVLAVGTSGALAMMNMSNASSAIGLGALLIYMAVMLAANIYGVLVFTVFCRVIADQAQDIKQPLAETFSGSVLPTVYQIAAGILLAIPMILLGIVAALLRSPAVMALLMVILFFAVWVRLCYSFIAIAVAGKGPIEGFVHSWKMTSGKNYLDALLMCLMIAGSVLLMELFFAAIFYGLYVFIPLHFANGFDLAHPSLLWILVGFVLAVLAVFFYFVILAFPVLVFLNRNAVLFDARTMEKDTTFVPLPGLELPDIRPNPDHAQQSESTIRTPVLTDADLRPVQDSQPAPQPKPLQQTPQPAPEPQEMPALEGLEVSQSSINTSEEDTNTLSQHLDKVYTPKADDIVQYGDEDRMPTILFDDEMAKQLQQNQAQFAPKPKEENGSDKDNGPDTIKMSKF